MVVTRMVEVASKGKEWASSSSTTTPSTSSSPSKKPMESTSSSILLSTTTVPAATATTETESSSSLSSSSYWGYATSSIQGAAESMSGMVSSLYGGTPSTTDRKSLQADASPHNPSVKDQDQESADGQPSSSYFYNPFAFSAAPIITSRLGAIGEYGDVGDDDDDRMIHDGFPTNNNDNAVQQQEYTTPSRTAIPRRSTTSRSPWNQTPHSDLVWMFRNNKNPYNAVRGHDITHPDSSLTAVRSLVALVPNNIDTNGDVDYDLQRHPDTTVEDAATNRRQSTKMLYPDDSVWSNRPDEFLAKHQRQQEKDGRRYLTTPAAAGAGTTTAAFPLPPPPPASQEMVRERSLTDLPSHHRGNKNQTAVSPSETASQLAEGTIRALRDLALDEAVNLQSALRFWNSRWERPLLSWLEAGPMVWTSRKGYNHQKIGRKVAHLQAVLARRCAAVGELQQHLLRAGWHRGVAQWGVLGQGGQWAAVAGFDGSIPEEGHAAVVASQSEVGDDSESPFSPELSIYKSSGAVPVQRQSSTPSDTEAAMQDDSIAASAHSSKLSSNRRLSTYDFDTSPRIGVSDVSPQRGGRKRSSSRRTSRAQVFVGKRHGEGIFVDDPDFLAEWSVEAIRLVRRHLFRAGNGRVAIPFESNWGDESVHNEDETSHHSSAGGPRLPLWAEEIVDQRLNPTPEDETAESTPLEYVQSSRVIIADLPLMVKEVEELLDIMEGMMEIQRQRRLERLKPPGWLRSNWYIVASVVPSCALLLRRLYTKGYGKEAIKFVVQKVSTFFRERLFDPVLAIFEEVWRGRESFSDQKARMEAIESLKKMIRSWLDDTFPDMPVRERQARAEAMDVTLIEKKKEESMKTFYEINNVVRMSFIEMQYMKKEMMNALHAMDEMMSANDINMNLAAITPTALLGYLGMRAFRLIFYAFLKLGKSREETYAQFRLSLTDIERLLLMRDNPPPPPPLNCIQAEQTSQAPIKPCVLGSDDLGMLMLLIHECRSILWRDSRRFSQAEFRSVVEDLAELAGERGAVSVQQQLSIINRMCRSYTFLKVISTGILFHYERPHS